MTTITANEIKELLATKLHDEGTYFTKKHISVKQIKNGYAVTIKDYEHIPFTITAEEDEYFGYCVYVRREDTKIIYMADSKKAYKWAEAIRYLGYYIGNRF